MIISGVEHRYEPKSFGDDFEKLEQRDAKIYHAEKDDLYLLSRAELRGFAPIGILEYWNDGIMG
jgi:hypothetical protein